MAPPVELRPPLEVVLARPVSAIPDPGALAGGCLYARGRSSTSISMSRLNG